MFIPVASPICLRRLRAKETPELGIIMPEQDCYPDYQKMLDSVTAEEFPCACSEPEPGSHRPSQSSRSKTDQCFFGAGGAMMPRAK